MSETDARAAPDEREADWDALRERRLVACAAAYERFGDDSFAGDLRKQAIARASFTDGYMTALAARPAPVVNGEDVERAARGMWESRHTGTPWAEAYPPLAEMYRDLARDATAALGITVADAPAADDEEAR